jgi:hydrogenase-4 component E
MPDLALASDGMQLLGGVALVLAVVLLCAGRARACAAVGALLSWDVALAMAWQGWVRGEPPFYAAALIVLVAQGILIPFMLARASQRRDAAEARPGAFGSLLLGLAAAVLATLVVRPVAGAAAAPAREQLAVALSVVLLGLIAMATRRDVLLEAVSLSSVLNGAILAAMAMPEPHMPVRLALAAAFLATAVALGAIVFERLERLGGGEPAGSGRPPA